MTIVSPFFIFPPISWWAQVINAETIIFDKDEHFQKMTARNRYDISGANNRIKLSIPLTKGREQRIVMSDVIIYNEERWQVQHWRTLVSVYKRSPFFDHYEDSLKTLFETPFTHLTAFNLASVIWVKEQLKLDFNIQQTENYIREYPKEIIDLRHAKNSFPATIKYYQVFEDRIGFQPDLSILDLMFSEGPVSVNKLRGK